MFVRALLFEPLVLDFGTGVDLNIGKNGTGGQVRRSEIKVMIMFGHHCLLHFTSPLKSRSKVKVTLGQSSRPKVKCPVLIG